MAKRTDAAGFILRELLRPKTYPMTGLGVLHIRIPASYSTAECISKALATVLPLTLYAPLINDLPRMGNDIDWGRLKGSYASCASSFGAPDHASRLGIHLA
jgi:hypothetical protein